MSGSTDPYTTGEPVGLYVNGKLVSAANPLPVTGGTGGSSGGTTAAGSVTAPGTAGTQAQAVQGIPGGIPVPVSGSVAVSSSPDTRTNDTATTRSQTHDDTLAAAQVGAGVRIIGAGTTGTDYSVNAATVPSGTALVTIPVAAGRAFIEVQNQSTATLQLVRDDGTGANQTTIYMAPAATAGAQGGGWSSSTFKGRVRVFGAAGAQVAAYQD